MTEAEGAPRREHTGGVIGILAALLIVLLAAKALLGVRNTSLDGPARLAEIFGEGELPFGLSLTEAARLPSGEVLLRLAREPDAGVDPEAEEAAGPVEVVLVEARSPAAVNQLFEGNMSEEAAGPELQVEGPVTGAELASRRLMQWEEDPSFAWHTTVERDEIAWSRWRAPYRVERAFREGGGWQDSARVNLTQPGRSLVLFAQWPDETEVSREDLRRLLRAVRMKEEEATTP